MGDPVTTLTSVTLLRTAVPEQTEARTSWDMFSKCPELSGLQLDSGLITECCFPSYTATSTRVELTVLFLGQLSTQHTVGPQNLPLNNESK